MLYSRTTRRLSTMRNLTRFPSLALETFFALAYDVVCNSRMEKNKSLALTINAIDWTGDLWLLVYWTFCRIVLARSTSCMCSLAAMVRLHHMLIAM